MTASPHDDKWAATSERRPGSRQPASQISSDLLMIAAAMFGVLALVTGIAVVNTGHGMSFAVAVAATTCTTISTIGLVVIAMWLSHRRE